MQKRVKPDNTLIKLRKPESCQRLAIKPKVLTGFHSQQLWKGSKTKRMLISKKFPVKES